MAGFLAATLDTSVARDEIKTYLVPKEHPPLAQAAATGAPGVDVNAAPIHWSTPAGWEELAPTAVRIGNFRITGKNGKHAEVAITSFPGSVGSELDNINRWRREIELPSVSEPVSKEVTPVTIDAIQGKLYDMTGPSSRTVVASLPRQGASWFFKLRGDKEVVADAKPAFLEFLKSIHFHGRATEAQSAGVLDGAAADPHARPHPGPLPGGEGESVRGADAAADPHAGLAPVASESSNAAPKWDAPSNWKEKPASMMVLKSFSVTNDKGQEASIAISVFPGDVGGTFANVNRWRRQMSLPPIKEDELPTATRSIDVLGGKATLVEMNGTDAKSGKPARLVAVSVPSGGSTWFYKLAGDEPVVAAQKEAFLKFVQTVRY